MIRINITSVFVDDQAKALAFYTEKLGFIKKTDEPAGDARWLIVVSPTHPDGVELLLEPDSHPATSPFKEALVADGIPFTQFAVDDVYAEVERLKSLGVQFTQDGTDFGPVVTAVFDDTCGNLIQFATLVARKVARNANQGWLGEGGARTYGPRMSHKKWVPQGKVKGAHGRPSQNLSPKLAGDCV